MTSWPHWETKLLTSEPRCTIQFNDVETKDKDSTRQKTPTDWRTQTSWVKMHEICANRWRKCTKQGSHTHMMHSAQAKPCFVPSISTRLSHDSTLMERYQLRRVNRSSNDVRNVNQSMDNWPFSSQVWINRSDEWAQVNWIQLNKHSGYGVKCDPCFQWRPERGLQFEKCHGSINKQD